LYVDAVDAEEKKNSGAHFSRNMSDRIFFFSFYLSLLALFRILQNFTGEKFIRDLTSERDEWYAKRNNAQIEGITGESENPK